MTASIHRSRTKHTALTTSVDNAKIHKSGGSRKGAAVTPVPLSRRFRVTNGAVAQLGERLPCTEEVRGSNPLSSTLLCA